VISARGSSRAGRPPIGTLCSPPTDPARRRTRFRGPRQIATWLVARGSSVSPLFPHRSDSERSLLPARGTRPCSNSVRLFSLASPPAVLLRSHARESEPAAHEIRYLFTGPPVTSIVPVRARRAGDDITGKHEHHDCQWSICPHATGVFDPLNLPATMGKAGACKLCDARRYRRRRLLAFPGDRMGRIGDGLALDHSSRCRAKPTIRTNRANVHSARTATELTHSRSRW
jgi:hypothetical protein